MRINYTYDLNNFKKGEKIICGNEVCQIIDKETKEADFGWREEIMRSYAIYTLRFSSGSEMKYDEGNGRLEAIGKKEIEYWLNRCQDELNECTIQVNELKKQLESISC